MLSNSSSSSSLTAFIGSSGSKIASSYSSSLFMVSGALETFCFETSTLELKSVLLFLLWKDCKRVVLPAADEGFAFSFLISEKFGTDCTAEVRGVDEDEILEGNSVIPSLSLRSKSKCCCQRELFYGWLNIATEQKHYLLQGSYTTNLLAAGFVSLQAYFSEKDSTDLQEHAVYAQRRVSQVHLLSSSTHH
nr:hypothetical protein Iba_chr03aCG21450 [Ipomoea batatas]